MSCTPAHGPPSSSSAPARSASSSTTRRAWAHATHGQPGSTRGVAWRSPARRTATELTTCSSTGSARTCWPARRARSRDRRPLRVNGIDDPFGGLSWAFGPDGAANQTMSASFVSTSGILPRSAYPQFNSWPSSRYSQAGRTVLASHRRQYVYSQISDVAYKRLTREIACRPMAATSRSGRPTTPSRPGTTCSWRPAHRRKRLDDAAGRERPHDHRDGGQLRRRVARPAPVARPLPDVRPRRGTCTGTGTPGAWNAASGNSAGWQEWRFDLPHGPARPSRSRSPTRRLGGPGLGVFIDDVTLPDGTSTSFESGFDGWEVTGPPRGSGPNANNWIRTDAAGFPVGSTISTPDSILMGFGTEGISTQASRNAVMGRVLDHLLD